MTRRELESKRFRVDVLAVVFAVVFYPVFSSVQSEYMSAVNPDEKTGYSDRIKKSSKATRLCQHLLDNKVIVVNFLRLIIGPPGVVVADYNCLGEVTQKVQHYGLTLSLGRVGSAVDSTGAQLVATKSGAKTSLHCTGVSKLRYRVFSTSPVVYGTCVQAVFIDMILSSILLL